MSQFFSSLPTNSTVLKKFAMTLTFSLSLSACMHINSVSLTPIPSDRHKVVKAEVSKTIFLGFNFNNDYIDPLVADLQAQCPNGVISGILTKDETTTYPFVFTKHVIATGYCNTSVAKSAANSPRHER